MFSLDELPALHKLPAVFTREHDVILLASPFALLDTPPPWTAAHTERLHQAVQRRFLRSAQKVTGSLTESLGAGETPHLTFRLTSSETPATPLSLLLTCAPNAHLALALVLERNALFTTEVIGRVTSRSSCSLAEKALTVPVSPG